jgi:carboxyl-terminal processing protease
VFDLPGGSALKLTTARYYTPSGRSIQAEGVMPDLLAEQPRRDDEPEPLREEALEGHLAAQSSPAGTARAAIAEAPRPAGAPPSIFANDLQAQRAYQVLKGSIRKK